MCFPLAFDVAGNRTTTRVTVWLNTNHRRQRAGPCVHAGVLGCRRGGAGRVCREPGAVWCLKLIWIRRQPNCQKHIPNKGLTKRVVYDTGFFSPSSSPQPHAQSRRLCPQHAQGGHVAEQAALRSRVEPRPSWPTWTPCVRGDLDSRGVPCFVFIVQVVTVDHKHQSTAINLHSQPG